MYTHVYMHMVLRCSAAMFCISCIFCDRFAFRKPRSEAKNVRSLG